MSWKDIDYKTFASSEALANAFALEISNPNIPEREYVKIIEEYEREVRKKDFDTEKFFLKHLARLKEIY